MNPDQKASTIAWLRTGALLFGIFVLLYAFEFTNFNLSIDDEYGALRIESVGWVGQGRWTAYLLEKLLYPRPALPFVPIASFGILLVASYLVLHSAIGRDPGRLISLLSFPLFAAFPIWSFLTEFQVNTAVAGVGLLACSLAVLLARPVMMHPLVLAEWRATLLRIGAAAALLATGIGAYQSMAMLYVVLGLGITLLAANADASFSWKNLWRALVVLGGTTVAGMIGYLIVDKIMKRVTGVGGAYISDYLRLQEFFAHTNDIFIRVWWDIYNVYSGSPVFYGIHTWSFGIIILFGAFVLAARKGKRGALALNAALVALYAIALLLPFALNPTAAGEIPLRALVGVPVAVWVAALLGLQSPTLWHRRFALALTILGVFHTIYAVNYYQANIALVREHDSATAAAIYQRIAETQTSWDRATIYPIYFYGPWYFESGYRRIWSSTAGASFFEWDNGNPNRIWTYMSLLGYGNLKIIPVEDQAALDPVAASMPMWPAAGSVQLVNGVTIVKLGKKPF